MLPAAGGGHLECLKYLHKNGCPWDALTCADAAAYGRLVGLKYVHENGCPKQVDPTALSFDANERRLRFSSVKL